MAARGGGWPGNAEALHVSFSRVCTTVDLRPDHSQEFDIKGREVSRGDGNLVSVEYECFILFEP